MSTENNKLNGTDQQIVFATQSNRKISIYALRNKSSSDRFKIKADFTDNVKYIFEHKEPFDERSSIGPYIYRADLDLLIDNQNLLYCNTPTGLASVCNYKLRLGRKIPQTNATFRDYNDETNRFIDGQDATNDYFLFNVNFAKNFVDNPPGNNVPFWSQFCLYTFYILHHKRYDLFDTLIDQFRSAIREGNHRLSKEDFNDFFQTCFQYLRYAIVSGESQHTVNKIIARMVGFLPVSKLNFDLNGHFTKSFTSVFIDDMEEHFDAIVASITPAEWPLFRNGLSLLVAIELLTKPKNTIKLVHRINNETFKKDLANILLQILEEFHRTVIGLNWTDLFGLADQNILTIKQLELTDSIQVYITSLVRIVAIKKDEIEPGNSFSRHFDQLIFQNRLIVDLDSIVFLLKFMDMESSETDPTPKKVLRIVNVAVESSIELRKKIKEHLYGLVLTEDKFENIRLILSFIKKSSLLFLIERKELLRHLMDKSKTSYSSRFFQRWFDSFLIFDGEDNDRDKRFYQELLQHWSNHFIKSDDILSTILINLDASINAFNNPVYQLVYISHMINICFAQQDIYRIIFNTLLYVENETFHNEFKNRFQSNYLTISPDRIKQSSNNENPLNNLIRIAKQISNQSRLLNDLIQITCNKIQFSTKEILRDTFEKPTSATLIYAILFDNCLQHTTLRQTIIDQLLSIWNTWEIEGFRASQLLDWKGFSRDQREIVSRIWNYVGEIAKKQYQINELIDKQRRIMEEKIQIIDSIRKCLETYCQNAFDIEIYFDVLSETEEQLKSQIIHSVKIPEDINKLLPSVNRLSSFEKLYSWKKFYEENRNNKNNQNYSSEKQTTNSNDIIDEDSLLFNEKISTTATSVIDDYESVARTKTTKNAESPGSNVGQRSCLEILQENIDILDSFIENLKRICSEWKILPIIDILNFFPDIQYVDHDFEILKNLLESDTTLYFKFILDYWKKQEYINQICRGYINMQNNYENSSDKTCKVLRKLLDINKETLGLCCYNQYESFSRNILQAYSENTLNFVCQYDISWELIRFLNQLNLTDVDNLLQAVNDWDETLINTKTVLDFVLLKRFLHQFDNATRNLKENINSYKLEQIEVKLEIIFQDEQFKNIFNCFQTCNESLISIKRIHLELTDKELSKRKRISDIMKSVTFHFTIDSNQFNLNIQPQSMSFNDLSELRDRARLMEYSIKNNTTFPMNSQRDTNELRSFVTFVETIEKILKHFSLLNLSGYPSIFDYLSSNKTFTCINSKYQELMDFSSMLENLLSKWDEYLCAMYRKHIELTYFFYQQVWVVEKYLYNYTNPLDNNHPGYHLLKYISIEPQQLKIDDVSDQSQDAFERLKRIGTILSAQRDQYEIILKEENRTIKKVYLIETSDDGILRAILSLFDYFHTPTAVNHLLYCSEETSWTEIRAFIYRCFYSQKLHQLIRPELLSASIHDNMTHLLKELIDNNSQHYFRLGIITTVSTTHLQLINGLRSLQIVHTVHDQDMLNKTNLQEIIRKLIEQNSILVTSRINGLGKTYFINQEIKKLGKTYIKFPIHGDIDADHIAERFHSSLASKAALHIDIGIVNHAQRLNEILYCILIFRSFRFRKTSAYIPNDIPIFIELDSSPFSFNLQSKMVLFKYMNSKHIENMDWNLFDTINASTSVQLIVNYLKAIKDETILKKDITEDNLIQYNQSTCINLLKEEFLKGKNPEFITWTQLSIFISVYFSLFSGFSRCGYLLVEDLGKTRLRLDILQSLLKSSNEFTSLCVESVRTAQRLAHSNDDFISFSEAIIRWDRTQPFTVIFSDTDNPIFVYKNQTDVPVSLVQAFKLHYEIGNNKSDMSLNIYFPDHKKLTHKDLFLKLASLSKKYFNKSICCKCYRQYDYNAIQCTHCESKDILVRPKSFDYGDIKQFQEFIANKIQLEYVLTSDNYIKMLLVYLRVRSGLPVLIMGETGCGKTALIQFLCQKILDDDMEVFRIHAGITNEQIIEKFQQYILRAYECYQYNKRLWVFLDEFNTTPNISLIKEIMCERTLLGKPLSENMVLLGACNPQRRKKDTKQVENNIGIKKDLYEMQRLKDGSGSLLLYTVVPIPETMLEYVWDYGFLDDDVETKYIQTMLNTCENLTDDPRWFELIVLSISTSQNFFRSAEDVSSVSLRDVARFCRLYNWFKQSIVQRETMEKFQDNSEALIRRASITALFLCYYFRLNCPSDRKKYTRQIEKILRPAIPKLSGVEDLLSKLVDVEQKRLIDRMKLPNGTAKNRALMDNIFVTLVCIVNRIPVIICGKPGCSKTSAVQIVISNLKGKKSSDEYFQKLPELITVSYQGSQNCTSESIIKVFQRADKYLNVKTDTNILPVIVFDEIGLAELSSHNPLKVLHSKLEVETCQYGFVGLSNWRLDASKMNRTLYLSCPDPDEDDLKLTAEIIANSLIPKESQIARIDPIIINSLAVSYYRLYEYLNGQQEQQKYTNYFGLRDFYSLIKGVVNELMKSENQNDRYECIRREIVINFDGMFDGSQFIWKCFCENMRGEHFINEYSSPTFKQLIDKRLKSRQGRYLMLIANNESVIDYVERYIIVKHQPPPVRTLIGSCFSGDLISGKTYTEQYNYRVLMDVILYAETNVTLIMRRMGHLYDNLYDLFNQNFAVSGKKKYCRIALGALYHPRCLINDDFYCIVFIRKEEVDKCDPPFLNRFEKHCIDMKSLIHQNQWTITDALLNELINLLPTNINKYFPLLQHLFVDYSNDYICNLVIDAFDYNKISNDDETKTMEIMNYCKKKLIQTSTLDLMIILALKTNSCHPLIDQYYDTHENLSFESILNQALNENAPPNYVIYTYTQIYDTIEYKTNEIEEIKLSIFKCELDLTNKIKQHYQKQDQHRLLIIRVDYHQEHEHILLLKHILLNSKVQSTNRNVWLIFHLQRNLLNQTVNDVLFNGWSTIMINDLNHHKLIRKDILLNPSYRQLIKYFDSRLSECLFDEIIDRCLTKFRYTVSQKDHQTQINIRRNRINEHLAVTNASQTLRSIIENNLYQLIDDVELSRFNDWRHDLLTNGILIGTCRSFDDALQLTKLIYYENYLLLLFSHLEKHSFIDSFLSISKYENNDLLVQIWFDCLKSTLKTIDTTVINLNIIEMPLILNLHLPCATAEYEIIRSIREIINKRRCEDDINENELMNLAFKQLTAKSIYGSNIQLILNDTNLFKYYYSDQLLLSQNEAKIYQLSSEFIQCLLMSNPTRSITDYLKLLLVDYNELFEILRLFEISTKLINENDFINHLFKKQFIIDEENQSSNMKNDNSFFNLILKSEHFCLIPPKSLLSNEDLFECEGDAFIEVSLMNLIEYLVSTQTIDRINNIEQLTTTYSLVAHAILNLQHYSVNNLEKLRSFISLLRCITTLIPTNNSLTVFKQACCYAGFDATFKTCDDVHKFIARLEKDIRTTESTLPNQIVKRALLKLESEFLKNWLADHNQEYLDVITLMIKSDNNIWQYSAKLLTYIDRKLQLLPMIKKYDGQISKIVNSDEFNDVELLKDYENFDEHIEKLKDSSRKIERIIVTRIHMHFMLSVNKNENIENIIEQYFTKFEENIRDIQNEEKKHGLTLVFLISWLKYYSQLYALCFINGSQHPILENIDKLLTRDDFLFCSTIKLFIAKQICQMLNITLDSLREMVVNRNVTWIRAFINFPTDQQTREIRRSLILPTPLFECYDEYRRVDNILTNSRDSNQIKLLINDCGTKQDTFYCFLIWFIHHYSSFYNNNGNRTNTFYLQLIRDELCKEIVNSFELIGFKLLVCLCGNFNNSGYFHLHSELTSEQLHQRLAALNLIAVLLSYKNLSYSNYLSSILYDGNLKMPQNYFEHFQTSVCLPGLMSNDPVVTQMIDVCKTVKERLDQRQVHDGGKFIFRCSKDCLWTFYFVDCGVPNDRSLCPLCKNEIGASQYGVLIERNPPQIRMSVDEGFAFIDNYLKEYNRKPRYGYHNSATAIHSNEYEKPDHLNRSVSYRFMHMITHVVLLFLNEVSLFEHIDIKSESHFREHYEKDIEILKSLSINDEQFYIWLYKLMNHMINKDFFLRGFMNSNEKAVQLEKVIEEKLLFTHIDSIENEIKQYKTEYANYIHYQSKLVTFEDFFDEIHENEDKYPALNFFNITNIYTSNPIKEFRIRLQTVPYGDQTYPITSFLMKRLNDYSNIQYLYQIVQFTNYLIEKFNHRIKRNHASETSISYFLKQGSDSELMSQLYEKFIDAWYKLDLNEIRYGCQTVKFQLPLSKDDFAANTKLAMVLLNIKKDDSSIVLAAVLRAIGELQNEIVNFFHQKIINNNDTNTYRVNSIPIQSIRKEHILHLDQNIISTKLITDGFTINYNYGKSKDIIYDYEEIEITLRNMISCLPLIDTENLNFLNYQFELYNENTSLINEIRKLIKQEPLKENERNIFKNLVYAMPNDDILHYLGSLDYVFTYLRNIDNDAINDSTTIQIFVERHVRSSSCLNDNIFQRPPFATTKLKHIIDLYELVEEIAFDQVLRHYIKQDLIEDSFTNEQRIYLIKTFSNQTYKNTMLSAILQNIQSWIGMLKRLMVRVLSSVHVSLDVPIQLYLDRTDLWTGNVTEVDIEKLQISDEILLQHTYILLKGLENEYENLSSANNNQPAVAEQVTQKLPLQNIDTQLMRVQTWQTGSMMNVSIPAPIIRNDRTSNRKMRV